MAIDLYHSHRGMFKLCEYWKRDDNNPIEEWVSKKQIDGYFYAKLQNNSTQANNINGVIEKEGNRITLLTQDKVDISPNNIVRFMGKLYVVDNVQISPHLRESEFSNEIEGETYISLRR